MGPPSRPPSATLTTGAIDGAAAFADDATLPMTAAWLLLFSLPLLWLTPDTPRSGKPLGRTARAALGQLRDSFRAVRQYGHIVRFLVARLFYVEGLTTVFIFGGVYAQGTFGMNAAEILAFGIGMNIAAGLGALAFSWIDDWIGGKRTVTISLVGLMVPGTALLLVRSILWFWVFAMVLGVFIGPAQAGSRSYLARVAPEKLRNQLFGLYTFSGKAVAFLGPLLVGGLTHLTQSQRIGMSAVVGLMFLGFLVWLTVPREDQVSK
jgi:MFS transporter, UMF1 family